MKSDQKDLGGSFDGAVSLYDKMRPGYVDELYEAVFDYIRIDERSVVLEVGSGSGQATLPMLRTGCALTAVEYGENMCRLLREKFSDYGSFRVINGKFEDVSLGEGAFDLVFSATAFHWVPEEAGYPKVFSILKEGGVFARFANRPQISGEDPELLKEIDEIYNRRYNKHYGLRAGTRKWFTEDKAREIALIPEKYGFSDIRYHLFHRQREFTAGEYVKLLGTYSDHIAMDKEIRDVFFSEIEDAIERHGGRIRIEDTLDLELARKEKT